MACLDEFPSIQTVLVQISGDYHLQHSITQSVICRTRLRTGNAPMAGAMKCDGANTM
jgi:hypothetical protein